VQGAQNSTQFVQPVTGSSRAIEKIKNHPTTRKTVKDKKSCIEPPKMNDHSIIGKPANLEYYFADLRRIHGKRKENTAHQSLGIRPGRLGANKKRQRSPEKQRTTITARKAKSRAPE